MDRCATTGATGTLAAGFVLSSQHRAACRRALALTSSAFTEAGPRRAAVLDAAAGLLTDALHSGCSIRWLPHGSRATVAVAHPHAREQSRLRALAHQEPAGLAGAIGARVLATGEPIVLPVLWSALLRLWVSPVYSSYLDGHEVSGLVVVPLVASPGAVGTLTVWREQPAGAFDEQEVHFLEAVARRLVLC